MARSYGTGAIDPRGKDTWRIRYRVGGQTFSKTIRGSKADASRALRAALKSADDGAHVAPDRVTLRAWIAAWSALQARKVQARTLERYDQLIRTHILPALGDRPLQQITATEIDGFYGDLRDKSLSDRTVRHVHVTLKACLAGAVRKALLVTNPADRAEAPRAADSDVGTVLEPEELSKLVKGFRGHPLYEIVAAAAYTGARRNEILALEWADLAPEKKTLRIERALEETKAHGRHTKAPKTARGTRTIDIDDGLLGVLLALREHHLRIVAGIPDGAGAPDLSLVRLPDGSLIFPAPGAELTKHRDAHAVTRVFQRQAKRLGFKLRFHDLRGSHETLLLDAGIPVHTVAARCGHDPAVLLKAYAKRTRGSDKRAAEIIGAVSRGVLGR
jgi:integrase